MNFNRALIIGEPWIDKILSGVKTWEMRTRKTNIRGRVGLIRKGSGLIVGAVDIIDSLPYQNLDDFLNNIRKHQIGGLKTMQWRYPWVLKNVEIFEKPIPYIHPQGAVVWVKLEKELVK